MRAKWLQKAGFVMGVFLAIAFSLIPFLLFISLAFKTQAQVTSIPPQLWPAFSLDFFRSAIAHYGIIGYLVNSTIVAGSTTVITIALGTLAGLHNLLSWGFLRAPCSRRSPLQAPSGASCN